MTLTEIQDELNQHIGPHGHYLGLSVFHSKGIWTADVCVSVGGWYGTIHGPSYSARDTTPEGAARKAADEAIRRAPVEAWPYKPGYVYLVRG